MKQAAVLLLTFTFLVGCAESPVQDSRAQQGVEPVNDQPRPTPPEPQWVQFGIVEWISAAQAKTAEGTPEEAMKLSIRMDSGEEIEVVQAVSQAGRFNVGDRVRVLHIGEFYRVTYWPYDTGG
ncbi:hypothetical protein [Motiliproteus sp. SC1-56]|uniref:hypothetical protein n=1 Tax=Motiliproteus sp. SC1-56 TaxID=2799565 RepID=UPI001A8D4619|nr:hypothetical protein [Motiliproteus sp. SC1-56]